MPELMVSVSGIRGVVGESLKPAEAARFAAALATHLGGGRVVLSRDSRPSGEALRHAVLAGLLAGGCQVEDVGVQPTPTCGLAVPLLNARGGIQITASHNPAEWNGLKMFGPDGAVLSADGGQIVRGIFEGRAERYVPWDQVGTVRVPTDPAGEHLRKVCDAVGVAEVHAAGFRVLLDGNGGAGGPLGVRLLSEVGCEVVEVGCAADGHFAHPPEPTPDHLQDVAPAVPRSGAAVGFCLDPDSDRLALIDEQGRCVSEELTLALAVKFRLGEQAGPVAINMSTSRAVAELAAREGAIAFRSAVGERNVVELMRRTDAVIGGEGNGGVIDPRVGWVRDPFVGMVMVLRLMARLKQPLSVIVDSLPKFHMRKQKVSMPREQTGETLQALKEKAGGAEVNEIDGLRLDWPDGWLHVRPSNTEPVVRVIAEAADEPRLDELVAMVPGGPS